VIAHYEAVARKLGIEVRLNTEVHAKFMRSVLHQYDVCVVAAGARSTAAAWRTSRAPSACSTRWTSRTAACRSGARVVVVGGGKIGLTLAESLRKHQGATVTVVEADKRIAGDVKPSFKWRHASWVEELGITCLTSTTLSRSAPTASPCAMPRAWTASSRPTA
jgi:2,4-dienoyl-CoA reductase (NADPH2)